MILYCRLGWKSTQYVVGAGTAVPDDNCIDVAIYLTMYDYYVCV